VLCVLAWVGHDGRVVDRLFSDPRLAVLYDVVDGDRSDLDAYIAIVDEFAATTVLDVGCGTGSLTCRLASLGVGVVGIDPAAASLEVAKRKPHASAVRWICTEACDVPALGVDLALMTGNVAQVFVTDDEWAWTLDAIAAAVRPGGHLVFETRDPNRRAWERWTEDLTRQRVALADGSDVVTWTELIDVDLPLVTFQHVFEFEHGGVTLTSESTLRFRTPADIIEDLSCAGFNTVEIRDAPDRPGHEFVFIAERTGHRSGLTPSPRTPSRTRL
jgi:SAM-dependent methyltransferase